MFTKLDTIPARPLTGAAVAGAVVVVGTGFGPSLIAGGAASVLATNASVVSAGVTTVVVAMDLRSPAVFTWASASTLPVGMVSTSGGAAAGNALEGLVDFDPDFTFSASAAVVAGFEFRASVPDGVVLLAGSPAEVSEGPGVEVGTDGEEADGELAAALVCAPPVLTTAPGSVDPVGACDNPFGAPFVD
jgi:hypothetical protein